MADYDENGRVISGHSAEQHDYEQDDFDAASGWRDNSTQISGGRTWCHIMYGLHALSAISGILSSAAILGAFVFGWPSIIAVIINYLTMSNVSRTWLESHWRWQLRTFWFAVFWMLINILLLLTLIGIPLALLLVFLTGLWVLYRVARGWFALINGKAMPVPGAPFVIISR